MIPREYETIPFPLGGEITATVLANPARKEKRAYLEGRPLLDVDLDALHAQAEQGIAEAERALQDDALDSASREEWQTTRAKWLELRDTTIPAARTRYAAFREVVPLVFGRCAIDGFDFSTPQAALASLTPRDEMPDEVIYWLIELPTAVWEDREREAQSKPRGSSPAARNSAS